LQTRERAARAPLKAGVTAKRDGTTDMPGSKEIRTKIRSVQNTRKITKAMEMVAASKMKKAQERMRAARPYGEKIRNVAAHLSHANPEYRHPFLVARDTVQRIGIIVITTDKGLCGGLNTNVLRLALAKMKEWEAQGEQFDICAFGNKGLGFMQRMGGNIVSHVVGLGDKPHMDKLIGAIKVMLDGYMQDRFDRVMLFYTKFINTMKQEAVMEQLLPLSGEALGVPVGAWDYIYEPEAKTVLDQVLMRYVETLVYQAASENMASEQSARMVAMKAASDNAGNVIDELTLIYNKTRQASITKELSEIVGGAAAV
jgi:F-type H+-transporting ATPase subunit gamma